MVFVKVRETYDLHTVQNKMTVISIHTPKPDIIKRNFPGLLMQCKTYRPVSADVKVACASVLPLDPLGVGTGSGDVAPEDVFNPILYKAMSNKGMSQLEARINYLSLNQASLTPDVVGAQADVEVDNTTDEADEFNVYYGLLSDTHGWRHAHPQQGLEMKSLRPLVYDLLFNIGDSTAPINPAGSWYTPTPKDDGTTVQIPPRAVLGQAHPMPWMPCTLWSGNSSVQKTGFVDSVNAEQTIPYLNVVCGAIIVPPSRLHELFYRMVVEWTIEFSSIRSIIEITDFPEGLAYFGSSQHFQNYSYSSAKKAITGDEDSILDNDSCMVSANVDINKVM